MRTWLLVMAGGCLLLGCPLQVNAQEAECRAIIDQALKAQGGEALAQSTKGIYAKGKGTIHIMGMDLEFTLETFNNPPSQNKAIIQLNVMNMNIEVVNVVNGDKGWASAAGQTKDLDAEEIKAAKEQIYVESVTSLFPLKEKDKGFQLSPLGESKVGDTAVVGVQVAKKEQRDVNLYFDKKTYRLVKAEYRALDPFTKQEVTQEKYFSDFKELIPGMKSASKIAIKNDGNPFLEIELTEMRSVERHDASVFAKPQ
jgi:hypothetical protein